MVLANKMIEVFKRIAFPSGEPYMFRGSKLYFKAGTRPVRRKYIDSESDVVRNDVLQINYFEQNFQPNNILWDIGSHKGHYSIFAASIAAGPNQVFSFEPDSSAREVQEENIKLNNLVKKISLSDVAIGNINGIVKFRSMGGNANSHIVTDLNESEPDIVSVKSRTINSLLDELPIPDFVKIDTEGAEIDILKAAFKLLENSKVKFICELHPFAWGDFKVDYNEFTSILNNYGRRAFPLDIRKNVTDLPFYGTVLF